MNPVTVQSIADRFRALTVDEQARAQALIDDAWEELLELIPGIADRLTAGTLRPGLVVAKMRAAIIPILRNPEGWLEEEKGIDDYKRRWRRADGTDDSDGRIFSDEAIRALKGIAGSAFEIVLACQ